MSNPKKNLKNNNKRLLWTIAVVTIVNAVLVLFLVGMANKELAGDELSYDQLATNLIQNSTFSFEQNPPFEPTIYRTPGYPFLLALLYLISGKSVLFVKIFQFILFGVSAYLIYQLTKLYAEEKTARIASYFYLIYFPFLFLAGFLMTETVSIVLMLSLFLLIKKYNWQNNQLIALDLAIGIVMGVLTMVRPTMSLIVIPLILSLWLPYFLKKSSLPFSKAFVKSAIFGFGLLLVFTPWIIRNYSVTNRFIPFTSGGSSESFYVSLLQYNGKISYAFTVPEWENIYKTGLAKRQVEAEEMIDKGETPEKFADLPKTIQKEMLVNESYKKSINAELEEVSIFKVIKSLPVRLGYLWSTADFAPNNFLHRIGQIQYLAFVGLGVLGLLLSWRNIFSHWLLLLIPFYLTIIHCIFHEEPRYTIPARPFILIYCAIGAVWLWNSVRKNQGSKLNIS